MAARQRYYVGVSLTSRVAFRCAYDPTEASHGNTYLYVIGPFKTKRGARYMAKYGSNSNPHLQHVNDAEKYAKLEHTATHYGYTEMQA